MHHAVKAGKKLYEYTIRHELGHPAMEIGTYLNLTEKAFLNFPLLSLEDFASGNNDIPAVFFEAGDHESVGAPNVVIWILDISQVHLADGAKGSSLTDLHLKSAFDRILYLSLHGNAALKGLLKKPEVADTREGFGKSDFIAIKRNNIEFQDIAGFERKLSIFVNKLIFFDDPVDFGARIDIDSILPNRNDLSLDLVTDSYVFIHAVTIRIQKLGKTLLFVIALI